MSLTELTDIPFPAVLALLQVLAKYERFVLMCFIELREDMAWCPSESCNLAVRYVPGGGGEGLSEGRTCRSSPR